MPSLRIDLINAGVREAALTSPEVRGAVRQIAEETAARARQETENDVEVVEGGKDRARAYVRLMGSDGAALEAKERILGRSLPSGG